MFLSLLSARCAHNRSSPQVRPANWQRRLPVCNKNGIGDATHFEAQWRSGNQPGFSQGETVVLEN